MGLNLLSVEDTPTFEHNVDTLTAETAYIRDQTAVLSAAVQAYGEALDPRLRRAPPLGLGSGLAHFTAPFLEVLGRSHEASGSPWDNADKRLADALEVLNNPETTEYNNEMAMPLAVAIGAPMLQPLADGLRSVGAMREQLSLKTLDAVATKLNRFVTDDLDAVAMAHHSYLQRKAECDAARAAFLGLPRWVADSERQVHKEDLEDAKHTLDAARARLVLALCNADGKRRYVIIEVIRNMMESMRVFFERANAEMQALKPLLEHLEEYETQAREQAELKMAAQAEGLNDFHRKMADAEAAVAERLQERGEAGLVDGGGGNAGAAGGGAGRAPSQGASPYEGRSQDVAIRQALETGSHASSALGQKLIKHGYLLKLCGSSMERCYFVLDCKGFLAYNYGPADATKLLLPSTLDEGDPRGFDGDEGILLPIAQGAMGHAGGVARSAWGFLMGRSGNTQGPEGDGPVVEAAAKPRAKKACDGDGRRGRVELIVSTVKLDADARVASDLPFCFRIISPTHKLTLQAESDEDRREWVEALQGVIAELLTANSRNRDAALKDEGSGESVAEALASAKGNDECADCGEAAPDWGVINRGVLVCQKCAGAHRSLGTHLSKVRHVGLDTDAWTPSVKRLFKETGNEMNNSIWQGGVKDASAASWSYLEWQLEDELLAEEGAGEEGEEDAPSGRPDFVIETSNQATSADAAQRTYMLQDGMNTEERHKLIRAKYQEKRFMDLNKVGEMLAQGPGALVQAAKNGSIRTVLHLLAAGVPVNIPGEGGETPLHAACSAGGEVIAQALLLNGANALATDDWGLTPLEVAHLSGKNEPLVHLLQVVIRREQSVSNNSSTGATALHKVPDESESEIEEPEKESVGASINTAELMLASLESKEAAVVSEDTPRTSACIGDLHGELASPKDTFMVSSAKTSVIPETIVDATMCNPSVVRAELEKDSAFCESEQVMDTQSAKTSTATHNETELEPLNTAGFSEVDNSGDAAGTAIRESAESVAASEGNDTPVGVVEGSGASNEIGEQLARETTKAGKTSNPKPKKTPRPKKKAVMNTSE